MFYALGIHLHVYGERHINCHKILYHSSRALIDLVHLRSRYHTLYTLRVRLSNERSEEIHLTEAIINLPEI